MLKRLLLNAKKYAHLSPAIFTTITLTYLWRHYQLDDGLIYLRYIRNFQNGDGLVYNVGERFNGLTSPLYSYIVLLGSYSTANLQFLTIVLSSLGLMATSVMAANLLCNTKTGQGITALVVAGFGFFYSTFGMETTLFLALILGTLHLFKKGSAWQFIAGAMVGITRTEGLLLLFVLVLFEVFTKKNPPKWTFSLGSLGILAIPLVFNLLYYGALLPATGDAKIGQGKSGFWGQGLIFLQADYLKDWAFSGQAYLLWGLLILALLGVYLGKSSSTIMIYFTFSLLLLVFYVSINIPSYHWYFAPFFLFCIVSSIYGMERFIDPVKGSFRSQKSKYITSIFVVFVLVFAFQTNGIRSQGRNETYAQIGEWLKANTPEKSSIGLVEIGTVGWYSDRKIIDILGLTNNYNANLISQKDVFSWLIHYQPEYLLSHEPRWGLEESITKAESQGLYSRVSNFPIPGFGLYQKIVPDRKIINYFYDLRNHGTN